MGTLISSYIYPLIAGFLFLRCTHYYRFDYKEYSGYRLILPAIAYGLAFYFFANIYYYFIVIDNYHGTIDSWDKVLGNQYPLIGLIAVLLSGLLSATTNVIISAEKAKALKIKYSNNTILRVLYRSAKKENPILISLDTGKVYIGLLVKSEDDPSYDPTVGILPIMSGYRDSEKKVVRITHSYIDLALNIFNELRSNNCDIDTNDHIIAFPLERVASVMAWDESFIIEFDNEDFINVIENFRQNISNQESESKG